MTFTIHPFLSPHLGESITENTACIVSGIYSYIAMNKVFSETMRKQQTHVDDALGQLKNMSRLTIIAERTKKEASVANEVNACC